MRASGTPRIGVELTEAKGKNDGLVGSFRYFTCKPKHGVLTKPENVSPAVVPAVPNARKPSLTHVMVGSADDLYSPSPELAPTMNAAKGKEKVAGAKTDSVKYVNVFEAQPYGTYSNVAAMLDGADA